MFLKEQKVFIKVLTLLFLFLVLSAVSAETIIVTPGDSNNTNPPGDASPTTDYIECPDGYSCIKDQDYEEFISGLKDFTAQIDERTSYFENIFMRFDKKLQLDENYISELTAIARNSQNRADELERKYNVDKALAVDAEKKTSDKIQTLEVQLAEMRAVQMWQFLMVVILAILLSELFQKVKGHGKFLWRRFQEIMPFKIG